MKEDFLHYIWRYGLYRQNSLKTADGLPVQVIRAGEYNRDSGPDFLDARIKIGSSLWVGHVEIHIRASDWFQHQHHLDRAYDQVILHVVLQNDRPVFSTKGLVLPTLSLDFSAHYYENYQQMVAHIAPIPCGSSWKNLSVIQVENALSVMGVERMETRFKWLEEKLLASKGGWRDLFFQVFFRAYGFGKNQDNFDYLAQSIPAVLIDKHRHNLFQLESLFFGQGRLIPERGKEPYPLALQSEYRFLQNKYNLQLPAGIVWKYMRTRPVNQPVPRLAQLAAWLHQSDDIFQIILDNGLSNKLLPMDAFVSTYWKRHHDFGLESSGPVPQMGEAAVHLLHINAILPLNAFYRCRHDPAQGVSGWVEALEQLPPERNQVMDKWKEAGFRIPNAFYSQAFLYIYKNFCVSRQCLQCRIGQLILQK